MGSFDLGVKTLHPVASYYGTVKEESDFQGYFIKHISQLKLTVLTGYTLDSSITPITANYAKASL